ncbi:prtrc system protein e [Pedobacter frigoris]|uniref:prtrc system protein e n=1 Tax=Pedobacter frigoris TaxID=2571272 RepID=UPI00292FCCD6|nr:prtrc system protein e [Pedobacter frigoris]
MKTNFFSILAALNVTGTWSITILKVAPDNLVVSIMLQNESCTDDARKYFIPLTLDATVSELDDTFFSTISDPLEVTSSIMTNMEHFIAQQEAALAASKMEQQKNTKAEKELTEKQKKYKKQLETVEALKKEGKYREAYVKVPDPQEYPEHAETLRSLREDLCKQFEPSLFNQPVQNVKSC